MNKYNKLIYKTGRLFIPVLLLLFSATPFLVAAFYTLPGIDDFSNAIIFEELIAQKGYWGAVFQEANNIYFTWQGTYSGNLILYSLNVLYNWGIVGIRVFSVFNLLLFLGSLLLLIRMIMVYIVRVKTWFPVSVVYGVICFCFFGLRIHSDFFYFHTAACMYTIPISFGALSIGFAVKEIVGNKKSMLNKVCCIIFGLLGCGGSLQIPAAICFVYLLLLVWSFFYRKDFFKEALILFLVILAGALLNALAPGNFVRQERMVLMRGGGFHVFRSLKYAIYMTITEIYYLLKDTYFLFTFWISFLCFYNQIPKYKINPFNGPVGVLVTVIVGAVITNFPLAMGHGSTYMENRNYSTLDLFLVLGLFFFLYALVNYLNCKVKIEIGKKEILVFIMCISIGFISCQDRMEFFSTPSFLCLEQLEEKRIQQSAEEWVNVFEYLEKSDEKEIALPYPTYNQNILLTMNLTDNPEDWVNRDLAEYYKKTAIFYSDTAEALEK